MVTWSTTSHDPLRAGGIAHVWRRLRSLTALSVVIRATVILSHCSAAERCLVTLTLWPSGRMTGMDWLLLLIHFLYTCICYAIWIHWSAAIYTVWVKKSPWDFLTFSPNGWEFPVQILHAYYTFLSPMSDKVFIQFSATLMKLCHTKRDHHYKCSVQNVHHRPKRTLGGRT